MKRRLSLILAVLMLVTALPFNTNALSGINNEPKELDVEYVSENGKNYIIFPIKSSDIEVLSNEIITKGGLTTQSRRDGKNSGIGLQSITPNNPNKDGAGQLVTAAAAILWETRDWDYPTNEGFKADMLIAEGPRANTVIATAQVKQPAKTRDETGTINTQFITTDDYKTGDEKQKIAIRFENKVRANARVKYADSVNNIAEGRVYYLIVNQISMPIYTSEWYDNNKTTRPSLKGMIIAGTGNEQEVNLPTENFVLGSVTNKEPRYIDENYMIEEGHQLSGKLIGTENFSPRLGSLTEEQLLMSPNQNAIAEGKFVSYVTKEINPSDFSATETEHKLGNKSGKIDSHAITSLGGNPGKTAPAYFYYLVGDNNHMWRFQMREVLQVKLNSGAGKVGTEANKDLKVGGKEFQEIGHSEMIKGNVSGREINFTTDETVVTPKAKVNGQEVDTVFKGWAKTPQTIDAEGNLSEIEGLLVNADKSLTNDGKAFKFTKKETTLYAVFAPKSQGKAKAEYKDKATNAAILDKYKISGKDYPTELKGNKDEKISDAVFVKKDAPKFVGYEIESIKTVPVPNPPATANYTENGDYTVIYTYNKLDPIIPAKTDDGSDNPKATDDVKATYKSVTIKVDTNKGQFKKGSTVKTEDSFVYYVNPVEGKSLQDVLTASGLTAESKDANVYKIDTTKEWTFNPAKTKANADVATSTEVTNTNFDAKNIDMEVNFAKTKADQLKDKLEPVDIRVWVDTTDTDGSKITWKNGVKLKDAHKNDTTLSGLLAAATVTDLGENGTLAQPQTSRNSSKANLPEGKKGNLKVAFDDGSALVVENQMLYVALEKNVVKPGEPNQIDPDKLPDGNLAVAFKLGKGVKIGTKEGNETTPVLYETYYVKPNTSLEAGDIPTTEVLNNNFKNNKWYNGANELAAADYTNITEAKTFIAKADEKGMGSVKIEYWADGTKLDSIEAYKLPGKTYITEKKGTEDAEVKAADLTANYFDLLGYEKDTTKGTNGIEVDANTKYLTTNQATVKFNYKKIDDIVGPVTPGTTKPAGYVTIMFKADADNQNPARGNFGTNIQDVVYYVNPKTVTIDKAAQKLSGKNKDNQGINKDFPTLTVTDNKFVANKKNAQGNYDASGTQQWLVNPTNGIVNNKLAQTITENDTLTLTAMYLGKFDVTYKVVVLPQGKELPAPLKALTAAYDNKAKDRTNLDPGTPYDTPQNIDINTLNEDAKKALIEEKDGKKGGEWTLQNWVKTEDNSGNVTFTLTWTFTEAGKPAPEQPPMPEYNPWWPIWFGSTTTEVKKEEPKHLERHDAYISGYPDGTVRPDGKITRAEVSAIFARLTENSAPANYSPKFSDVLAYDWFCDSVMKLSNKDIIKGYPDGTFKPNKSITRAEFAVIASKYIKNPKAADETFSDVPMNHWAKDAIAMVKAEGWISGYTDGTFKPDAPITRAEAVSIVNRMFDRAADGEFVRKHGFEIKKFNDLTDKHWAYYEIMEAVHTHDYERIDKRTERWDKIVK